MNRTTNVNKPEKDTAAGKKPKHPPTPQQPGGKSQGLLAYLKGVRAEWHKVSWPSWPQIWGQTLVVLFMTTLMSVGLWVIDNTFHLLVHLLVPSK